MRSLPSIPHIKNIQPLLEYRFVAYDQHVYGNSTLRAKQQGELKGCADGHEDGGCLVWQSVLLLWGSVGSGFYCISTNFFVIWWTR